MAVSVNQREKAEKSTQTYAALGIGLVCIVIGVPLWWKTTEVYRVQLPYQEITTLAQTQVKYYVDFTLVVFKEDIKEKQLATFGEKIKERFDGIRKKNDVLQAEYRGQVRHRSKEEADLFNKHTDLYALDEALSSTEASPDHGQIQFILVGSGGALGINRTWIGRNRNVFIPTAGDLESIIPDVIGTLKEILVNEATLEKVFYTAKGVVLTKADKKLMRSLKSHPGYDVTFTLLNPEPQVLAVDWHIQATIKEYMDPMLKAFAQFAEISVKSQCMHYTELGIKPAKDGDGFRLNEDQLPHIINPIEPYLSSHVSTNPNLNFVIYITPRSHYPLKLYHKTGELNPSNSFLSPRWGGVMVYNLPSPENVTLPAVVDLDMQMVMEIFLSQLRLLLAINPGQSQLNIDVSQAGKAVISAWEFDQWLRLRTLENIATATSTLRSLAQLLEEISNIVINDDIGREVERAVRSVEKAQIYLYQSRLREAFVFARQALLSSEKAFFDPSLLELLYFPEDQKFAIYIPLFLPISIPVLLSVIQALKRIFGKDKDKME